MDQPPPRTPGRPRASDATEARERLLHTAARRFAADGYEGTSLRQVAEGADVTPAMIAYYFGDKSGLLEAVVMDSLGHVLDAVRAAAEEPDGAEGFLPRLVAAYLDVIRRHPWIPQIMVREVISRDTPLRELVQREFMSRALRIVPPRIAAEIEHGRLRDDLDPAHTILSVLGMCIFPWVAAPVLGPLLGYRLDETFSREYTAHTIDLVLEGTRSRP